MKKITIASRASKLALWQSVYVQKQLINKYPNLIVDIQTMKTKGDIILDTPLAKIGGKGLFTKELEDSMLKGDSQISVHSLKDVPVDFPQGLILGAVTKRQDVRDAILSAKYENIEALPKNAVVGTTSLRRRMQLLILRPDLKIKNLRGNINTRIQKLKNGEFDAIILASAGINRLGLNNEVKYITPIEIHDMIPAMGQAALGIEVIDDDKIICLINFLNDDDAIIETKIERDFVRILNGGCQAPIGINAKALKNKIEIRCILGTPDGKEVLKENMICTRNEFQKAGEILAKIMIDKGGKEILKRAENMASNLIFD